MTGNYAELLKDPRWQKKRLEVFQRANWKCENCGDSKSELHVHHTFYDGREPWEYLESSLVCLCKCCHDDSHAEEEVEAKKDSIPPCNCEQYGDQIRDLGDYEFECVECGWSWVLPQQKGEAQDEYEGRTERNELHERMRSRMEADQKARSDEETGINEPIYDSNGEPWSYNHDMGDDQHKYNYGDYL